MTNWEKCVTQLHGRVRIPSNGMSQTQFIERTVYFASRRPASSPLPPSLGFRDTSEEETVTDVPSREMHSNMPTLNREDKGDV